MKVMYATYCELNVSVDNRALPYYLIFASRPALWQAYEDRQQIWHIPPIEIHEGWTVEDIAEME